MFLIEPRAFDHPEVVRLIAELQGEYVTRYGGPDETLIKTGEFDPPTGLFLVGTLDGDPVAAAGWRRVDAGVAEIKRMFVVDRARRRGLSRLMLAELESTASLAGY